MVDAYAQLAAEGYLVLRQGAGATVSMPAPTRAQATTDRFSTPRPRISFRPSVPDVSTFPRNAWLRSLKEAISTISDTDLGYGDVRGVEALRVTLADYLGRARGVVADPTQIVITSGYLQGQGLVCRALASAGAKRIAFEDPSHYDIRESASHAGLVPVPVPVGADGINVDQLQRTRADAVVLTPSHQHPTGVVLSGERRTALLAWLRERNAIAIEDDYDAEYRFDRAPVGALQGLDSERVVYAGSASKTLAPALRLGWLVLPAALVGAVCNQKLIADQGSARIERLAFADFLARGELDRHLRRMRIRYRRQRDALLDALAEALPEATVHGIAAGLHATVVLPDGDDEQAIVEEARLRRIELSTMREFQFGDSSWPPTLLLGYGQLSERAIPHAVHELAKVIRAVRAAQTPGRGRSRRPPADRVRC